MNTLLKEVLSNEVRPTLGCTEVGAVAFACASAMRQITNSESCRNQIRTLMLSVDVGTLKNCHAVGIPHTCGKKGIMLAASLGAISGDASKGLECLCDVTEHDVLIAEQMIVSNRVIVSCNRSWNDLRIEARIVLHNGTSAEVHIAHSHTHIMQIMVNENITMYESYGMDEAKNKLSYRDKLRCTTIRDLIHTASSATANDLKYMQHGIEMNLALSADGAKLNGIGVALRNCNVADINTLAKSAIACAVEARMTGSHLPAMSSGGSGNQGILTILLPYYMGVHSSVNEATVMHSIILAHLINARIKAHTGMLSPMCGCSVSAGIAASAALAYQHGLGERGIAMAIGNVVANTAGSICDGAKRGCTLKVAGGVDAAIMAAQCAFANIDVIGDGIVSSPFAEDTIKNLGTIATNGMDGVNNAVINCMNIASSPPIDDGYICINEGCTRDKCIPDCAHKISNAEMSQLCGV